MKYPTYLFVVGAGVAVWLGSMTLLKNTILLVILTLLSIGVVVWALLYENPEQ